MAQSGHVYKITMDATLKGDYRRFVQRMMDTDHYVAMEVPYVEETHKVLDKPHQRILWMHISTFPINARYYMGFDFTIGETLTKVNFRLLPKSGPYPDQHEFQIFSGHMTIKVISGEPQNSTYNIQSTTLFKLKPDSLDIPEITIEKLKFQAEWSLRAFAD